MKNLVDFKLNNTQEKPLQILKRLDAFVPQPPTDPRPAQICNAILIKIFEYEIKKELDGEEPDDQ